MHVTAFRNVSKFLCEAQEALNTLGNRATTVNGKVADAARAAAGSAGAGKEKDKDDATAPVMVRATKLQPSNQQRLTQNPLHTAVHR